MWQHRVSSPTGGWLQGGFLACCVTSGQLLNLSDSQLISYKMRLLGMFPAYILLFMPVKEWKSVFPFSECRLGHVNCFSHWDIRQCDISRVLKKCLWIEAWVEMLSLTALRRLWLKPYEQARASLQNGEKHKARSALSLQLTLSKPPRVRLRPS